MHLWEVEESSQDAFDYMAELFALCEYTLLYALMSVFEASQIFAINLLVYSEKGLVK